MMQKQLGGSRKTATQPRNEQTNVKLSTSDGCISHTRTPFTSSPDNYHTSRPLTLSSVVHALRLVWF